MKRTHPLFSTLAALVVMLIVAAQAQAVVTSFDDIEYWVGTGSQEAAAVIDFQNGDDALVWGFRWDGTLNAGDMFYAIDAADDLLDLDISIHPTFGPSFDGATYDTTSASNNWPVDNWYLLTGPAYNNVALANFGLRDTQLVDQDWYVFAYLDASVWPPLYTPSQFAAAPAPGVQPPSSAVPEPATAGMMLMGAGVLAVLGVGRRRRD